MAASSALFAIKISVLAIFTPTQATLSNGATTVTVLQRDGSLTANGAPSPSVELAGDPLVTVSVIDRGRPRITRHFRGRITIRPTASALAIVNELPDEDYLPGTVALEAGGDHPEALKAQAVLARTYLARGARHPERGADLCDLTHCQTYRGADGETDAARAAVAATRGQVLLAGGRLAEAYFTATCGGATADLADVWPDAARSGPHSIVCDDCRGSPDYSWRADLPLADAGSALAAPRLAGLTVLDRGTGGYVRRVRLDGDGRTLSGEQLRIELGRKLGWSTLKSARFTVEKRNDRLYFQGKGFGHGVGLCEAGAAAMARRGASYRALLARYFPGADVGPRP